ncbi:glycoside hydrolase superfamily [Umbelopsis sp. PMI_123]|nr:glycoside hydrolase superfamily [Umbelopsis sp. PMI_123]
MPLIPNTSSTDKQWWKEGIVYQIYPSSFKDSNGDGMGDIPGIISKLDYIKDLGIDIIWLSPFYASPQVDMGYDISDYQDVYGPYGTVDDVKELIQGCHKRNIRIIFDLVVNHTSDQHAWFKESRSSKTNPKRDWYYWRPAKYDEQGNRMPPCNWRSCFGGSAWTWDETTQEYYLNLFTPEQPDLNWENEEVRKAVYDNAMRFWLDLGVDGFRVDVVNMYSKHLPFADAPITDPSTPWQSAYQFFCNGPRMYEFLEEMNNSVLSHYDVMTVGELPLTPDPEAVLRYVSSSAKKLNMVFQMDLVTLGFGQHEKFNMRDWTLLEFKAFLEKWQCFIKGNDGWTTIFLENHDQARSISRFGCDEPAFRDVSGKMLATFLCTLTGTLFLYQGQEIGMINAPKSWTIEEYKDVESLNFYNHVKAVTNGDQKALNNALSSINAIARDHARTPFQWDNSQHGGFTTGQPWMRVNDSYSYINAQDQEDNETSILAFWRKAIEFRKNYKDLLIYGDFQLCDAENSSTLTYLKVNNDEKVLVVLNFTKEEQKFIVPKEAQGQLDLVLSNVKASSDSKHLGPFEARVYLIN